MSKAQEAKKKIVQDIVNLCKEYPIVGVVNMENLPAPQLQSMRADLREKVSFYMTKKTLMRRALENIKDKKGVQELASYFNGMPALIFTKDSPFKLSKILKKSKTPAPAKAGQTAPDDIVVKKGPTPFAPGPVISELGGAGLKVGVEAGKVAVKEDAVVAKKGDKIPAKVAEILARLDIKPMEVGLDLMVAYENEVVYPKDILDVDEAAYLNSISLAAAQSFNLAFNIAYVTSDNASLLLGKAYNDAKALGISQDILDSGIIESLLGKAEMSMLSLQQAASIDTKRAEAKEVREEKPVQETKKEEEKEKTEAIEPKPEDKTKKEEQPKIEPQPEKKPQPEEKAGTKKPEKEESKEPRAEKPAEKETTKGEETIEGKDKLAEAKKPIEAPKEKALEEKEKPKAITEKAFDEKPLEKEKFEEKSIKELTEAKVPIKEEALKKETIEKKEPKIEEKRTIKEPIEIKKEEPIKEKKETIEKTKDESLEKGTTKDKEEKIEAEIKKEPEETSEKPQPKKEKKEGKAYDKISSLVEQTKKFAHGTEETAEQIIKDVEKDIKQEEQLKEQPKSKEDAEREEIEKLTKELIKKGTLRK